MSSITSINSPLAAYANASVYIISTTSSGSTLQDGRYVQGVTTSRYLISGYITRVQASRTSSTVGEASGYPRSGVNIGADNTRFLYRGYCLGYAIVDSNFVHGVTNEQALVFNDIIGSTLGNGILRNNTKCSLRLGAQIIDDSYIEVVGGIYGSQGIDELIMDEIGGIPITIRGTEVHGYTGRP